ncbi:MAG: hypothetical protein U1G07_02940 [Verrucomicrobiota bacterium]
MCDFVGAGRSTGRLRWGGCESRPDYAAILTQLEGPGCGRLCRLRRLHWARPACSEDSRRRDRIAHLTNTGYYGGQHFSVLFRIRLPGGVDQLAEAGHKNGWDGIEETGVKPGFIKIGVDEVEKATGPLSSIDAKLVRASAKASLRTKLTVTCHTGGGPAGLEAARLFVAEGGEPARFIVAHSDGHGPSFHQRIAQLGAWISLDGVSRRPLDEHVQLVRGLLQPYSAQLLISQDNGW